MMDVSRYPMLARAIKTSHAAHGDVFYAHDFGHVQIVAGLCTRISPDTEDGRLAAVAALCHNADRILQKTQDLGPFGKVSDEEVSRMVREWLDAEPSLKDEQNKITDLVLLHSDKNAPDDPEALVILKDADRLAIMSPDNLLRVGQYTGDTCPAVNFQHLDGDPAASWNHPLSLFWSTQEWRGYVDFKGRPDICLRTPVGREIGLWRAKFLKHFREAEIRHLTEAGVI